MICCHLDKLILQKKQQLLLTSDSANRYIEDLPAANVLTPQEILTKQMVEQLAQLTNLISNQQPPRVGDQSPSSYSQPSVPVSNLEDEERERQQAKQREELQRQEEEAMKKKQEQLLLLQQQEQERQRQQLPKLTIQEPTPPVARSKQDHVSEQPSSSKLPVEGLTPREMKEHLEQQQLLETTNEPPSPRQLKLQQIQGQGALSANKSPRRESRKSVGSSSGSASRLEKSPLRQNSELSYAFPLKLMRFMTQRHRFICFASYVVK